ncbi:MAG: lysylphosphatidylglycerol synthase transmembrane domain-containing protein [Vicinamibacterales bacterium]
MTPPDSPVGELGPRRRGRRRLTALTAAVGLLAVLLFAWTLHRAGLQDILVGIRRIGVTGFLAVIALSGLRLGVRTLGWLVCLGTSVRLPFRDAFSAMLMGEALGNLTPLATVVSEPAKAVFVRARVPLETSFTALVVENLFYVLSMGLVIALGAVAFLFEFRATEGLGVVTVASLAVAGCVGLIGYAVLLANARPMTAVLGWLLRRHLLPSALASHVDGAARLEATVNGFTRRNRARLVPLVALEATFQVAGIAEVWLTLFLMGAFTGAAWWGLTEALVLESTGRVVNLLFKFVPFRVGVDEAGAVLVADVLRLGPAAGGALALARKARLLVWTAAGVALLVARGLSVGRAVSEAEAAASLEQER